MLSGVVYYSHRKQENKQQEETKMKNTLYNEMKKYIVFAESLQDFIDTWHMPGIITDFNREADYNDHKSDLEKYGYTIIPASSSVNGRIVSYYGRV
jgi:hypothetical protein